MLLFVFPRFPSVLQTTILVLSISRILFIPKLPNLWLSFKHTIFSLFVLSTFFPYLILSHPIIIGAASFLASIVIRVLTCVHLFVIGTEFDLSFQVFANHLLISLAFTFL